MSSLEKDKIRIRAYINDVLDSLIEESIYYRTNNIYFNQEKRLTAWQFGEENGKITIP